MSPEEADRVAREFRAEHGLGTEDAFGAWLVANQISARQFSALIEERVLLRMVLPRLREEASSGLPDLLRMTGHFCKFLARSAEKDRALEGAGIRSGTPAEGHPSEEFLLDWFLKRLGPPDEHTVEGQAAILEYAHQNLNAFLYALSREYRYLAIARDGSGESDAGPHEADGS